MAGSSGPGNTVAGNTVAGSTVAGSTVPGSTVAGSTVPGLLTAAVFVVMAVRFGPSPVLPAFCFLGAVGVALAFIDARYQRLPDALTLLSYPVALVLLGAAALAVPDGGRRFVVALIGLAAAWLLFLIQALIYPAGHRLGGRQAVRGAGPVPGLARGQRAGGGPVPGLRAGRAGRPRPAGDAPGDPEVTDPVRPVPAGRT